MAPMYALGQLLIGVCRRTSLTPIVGKSNHTVHLQIAYWWASCEGFESPRMNTDTPTDSVSSVTSNGFTKSDFSQNGTLFTRK